MKLNIAYPQQGTQKVIEVDDERKLRAFYDKRISHEVDGDVLGEDFKGYVFKITGGNDKQGFCMRQGVLTANRVRLLMSEGHAGYRPRKRGERKRKSIRGCVVSSELSVLNLVLLKKGEKDIAGLTDTSKPRRLGPKRATRIRKLFNLDKKNDDVRAYVIKREIKKDGKKPYTKSPKIQRLVTPQRLQRKRDNIAEKKQRTAASKKQAEEYNALLAKRFKEAKEKRQSVLQKKRSLSQAEKKSETKPAAPAGAATTAAGAPKAAAPKREKKEKKEKKEKAKTPAATGAGAGAPAAKAEKPKDAAKAAKKEKAKGAAKPKGEGKKPAGKKEAAKGAEAAKKP